MSSSAQSLAHSGLRPRLYWIAVGLLAVVTLAPMAAILFGSLIVPDPGGVGEQVSLSAWAGAFTGDGAHPGLLRAVGNTVALALAGQLIALPLSVVLAWLLGRTDIPGARWLELGFWISFFLPVLAVLQGWLLLIDPHYGLINQVLTAVFGSAAPQLNVYSWWGIVFAHLVTNTVSAKVMLLTPVYQGLDSRLEEAAQIAGDSPFKTLWRITLPLTLPIVLAAGTIGLIRTLESFEIELILGIPQGITVYSTLIYDIIGRDPPDFATANVLGVMIILFLTLLATVPTLISGSDRGLAQGHFVTLSSASRQTPVRLGRWRWPAFALVSLAVALLTIIPVGFLITSSVMKLFGFFSLPEPWTLSHWGKVLGDNVFLQSLRNTLQLATLASVLAVLLGASVAYGVVRAPAPARRVLAFLSWLPSTMPGILFSLAMLWIILSSDILTGFYGSTFSLACVVALGGLTFSVQILKSSFGQIGVDMEEAGWLAGASRLRAILTVVAPLALRSIAVVAVVAFVAATRSISNLALLVTSDNRPLALLQLEYMSQGLYEPSAVVGVIVVAMAVIAALAIRALSTNHN